MSKVPLYKNPHPHASLQYRRPVPRILSRRGGWMGSLYSMCPCASESRNPIHPTYRVSSVVRNSPPSWDHHRALEAYSYCRVLEGAVSYERGTPVPQGHHDAWPVATRLLTCPRFSPAL